MISVTGTKVRWLAPMVALVLVAGLAAGCGSDDGGGGSASVSCEDGDTIVDTGDNYFEPESLEIEAGTTVCWENTGRIHHNVVPDEGDQFGTGRIDAGEAYRYTFEDAGEYPYYCSFHGAPGVGQYGTVVVT